MLCILCNPASSETPAAKVLDLLPDTGFSAAKFLGTDVLYADKQKIGDVEDIVIGSDGKVVAYIVSVGGFLGVGALHIAFAPESFEIIPSTSSDSLKLMTHITPTELRAVRDVGPSWRR